MSKGGEIMNNNIWIKIPEKIKSDLDNDLENNFLIFKLQGAPESPIWDEFKESV